MIIPVFFGKLKNTALTKMLTHNKRNNILEKKAVLLNGSLVKKD